MIMKFKLLIFFVLLGAFAKAKYLFYPCPQVWAASFYQC